MAEVFKPTYTQAVPDGARIIEKAGQDFARFKRKGKTIDAPIVDSPAGKKIRVETAEWYVRCKGLDGNWIRFKGYTDKNATAALGQKLDNLVAYRLSGQQLRDDLRQWLAAQPKSLHDRLVEVGIIDAKQHEAGRPLAEHLADFETSLSSRRLDAKNIAGVVGRVRRVIDWCGFSTLPDIDPTRVEAYIKDRLDHGAAVQTCNHHLSAVKQFCNWLVKVGRAMRNPVEILEPGNAEADRRRERRDMADEEVQRLLRAAANSAKIIRGMTGSDRFVIYYVAFGAGLRASEIASLQPASFDLPIDPPTVTVEARYSKRRQEDIIPLSSDLAEVLRGYLAGIPSCDRVWPRLHSDHTAKMLKADLAEARAAWIKEAEGNQEEQAARERSDFLRYQDAAGRFADFHAARHTFATAVYSRLPSKIGREIVRHSSEALADRYTHLRVHDMAAAAASIPPLLPPNTADQNTAALRATGTDNASPGDPPVKPPETIRLSYACQKNATTRHGQARRGRKEEGGREAMETTQTQAPQAETVDTKADGARFERAEPLPAQQFSRLPVESGKHGENEIACHTLVMDRADPDLSQVVEAWPRLPEPIKAAMLALVRSATNK